MSFVGRKSMTEVNDDVDGQSSPGTSDGALELKVDTDGEEMELTTFPAASNDMFITLFEKTVKSIVQFLHAEQISHEMMAKALLKDILSQSKVLDGPVNVMADKLGASYKSVEQTLAKATDYLRKKAFEADTAIGTSCVAMLERILGNAEVSTAFFVVLSDIYEAGRLTHKEQDGKPKWEAPAAFERETTKYW
jgi:hypothetical protein